MTATAPVTATRGRFVWHELMTPDPAAAQKFYRDVVGWTTSAWTGGVMDYTMWMAGETAIGGVMTLPAEAAAAGAPPHWLAYIEMPDVDTTIEQAVTLGAKVLLPARSVNEVGRFAVLADPQGAAFAVITNATPMPPESDPRPLEFSWHELNTTDLPGAISFYEQLFGWKKQSEFDMGDKGAYHMFGRDRFTYGGMMKKPADMTMPSHWLHYISVPDSADAAAERATKRGATLMLGPMEVPGGDRIAILTDPQGAMFAVQSKPAK